MRVKQIDVLRGIAAILVAFFHLTGSSGLSKNTATYGIYGWLGVQIFFVISGFILPYSMYKSNYTIGDFRVFLVKRIVRIYPAYLLIIVIGIVLAFLTHRETVPAIAILSHLAFLNDLLGLPDLMPIFWTLAIEFQFYLLIGVAYPLLVKNNARSVIFIIVLCLYAPYANSSTIFYWFPFFGLGMLIFNKFFTAIPPKVFWCSAAFIIGLIFYKYSLPHAIAALLALLFIVFIKIEKKSLLNKILLSVGTISYSLYLVHWELGRAAVNFSKRLPMLSNMEFVKVLIGMAFSILSAYLLYVFVEAPSHKFGSKIKYKHPVKENHTI